MISAESRWVQQSYRRYCKLAICIEKRTRPVDTLSANAYDRAACTATLGICTQSLKSFYLRRRRPIVTIIRNRPMRLRFRVGATGLVHRSTVAVDAVPGRSTSTYR